MTHGWEAALAEAASPSWSRRARAGCALAPFAGVPEAASTLARLLLDTGDTAVTRRTAEALTRVGTPDAVRLVVRALAGSDDGQADWLWTGIHDARAEPDGGTDLAAVCARLARDPDGAVRQGAAALAADADRDGALPPRT
ncbi:HEAT repeat domain-containing protein [Streptomyces laurentii]|uniref:HEAT repeat domain-containing protein n=1 Tax=Streptomyces laurentii TaxID=39478 RepID=UPI0036908456